VPIAARVALGVAAGVAVAVVAFLFVPAIGGVSGKALDYSVIREADGSYVLGVDACQRKDDEVWKCGVVDQQGSTTVSYRVTMSGSRCWRAEKISRFREDGPPLEPRPSGCVKLRDQLRLFDRALGLLD